MTENRLSEESEANPKNPRRWFWGLLIYWSLLFLATHFPKNETINLPTWNILQLIHFDKIVHFSGYAILSILVVINLKHRISQQTKAIAITIGLLMVYAMLDEYTQRFVVGRSPEIYDWIADVLGTIVGIFLYQSYNKRKNNILEIDNDMLNRTDHSQNQTQEV